MKKLKSFSLIEMLIVIAIIIVLVSILHPSLIKAIENANQVVCMNKMRNIGQAFMLFADDHDSTLPTTSRGPGGGLNWQENFYGSAHIGPSHNNIKQYHMYRGVEGPIWDYLKVGMHKEIFRCPSLEEGRLRTGEGSNGLFDYCGFEIFGGAKTRLIPQNAFMHDPRSPIGGRSVENPNLANMDEVATPMLVEEDPFHHVNRGWEEVSHGSIDQMGTWHGNGNTSIYTAVDGSSHRVQFSVRGPKPMEWRIKHPKRGIISLHSAMRYGMWND